MKEKIFFLLCVICTVLLVSCGEKPEPVSPEKPEIIQPDNPGSNQKNDAAIIFKNTSSYDVSVYYNINPYKEAEPFAEIAAGGEKTVTTKINNDSPSTFYFLYNLSFGNDKVYFPYYPDEEELNHKTLILAEGENKVVIDEISKCNTKSSFLFLENNTTSDIYLYQPMRNIKPYKKDDKFVRKNDTGVYEVGNGNEGAFLVETAKNVVIVADAIEYPLPSITYEPGKIYTVTVSNNNLDGAENKITASLKTVTPFNVDTVKKMWSMDDKIFAYDAENLIRPVLKPASSIEKGSIVMGTVKNKPASVCALYIDQYKRTEQTEFFTVKQAAFINGTVRSLEVIDFVEQNDGSIIMLLTCTAVAEDKTEDTYDFLVAYDFKKDSVLWTSPFESYMQFRKDSSNKLISLGYNKVVVVGAELDFVQDSENADDEGHIVYYPYAGLFDFSKPSDANDGTYVNNGSVSVNPFGSDSFENESLFCSAYYDGSSIYVCGYKNCDFNYSSEIHTGLVYKFNADLSGGTCIYEKERCLFLNIGGSGSKWYTCGEYWKELDGKLLGCYVSSAMIAENSSVSPVFYYEKDRNAWFSQLCVYDNMIAICGTASEDKAGAVKPAPFVVAYDAAGNLLWENHSYSKWASAINIIPNAIGTYILQLTDSRNTLVHYVSADLLGKEVEGR